MEQNRGHADARWLVESLRTGIFGAVDRSGNLAPQLYTTAVDVVGLVKVQT
jgi:hypothetical protein